MALGIYEWIFQSDVFHGHAVDLVDSYGIAG